MRLKIPKGYKFAAYPGGLRYKGRNDLALVYSDVPAAAAGVFTQNRFKAAPVIVARERIASMFPVQALFINSGQANACTGEQGIMDCRKSLDLLAAELSIEEQAILPASTGVIGEPMPMDTLRQALPGLAGKVGCSSPVDAAKAIMTTDKFPKISAAQLKVPGEHVRIMGLAKGAGMICPDMATMLAFILCDARISPDLWQEMLKSAVRESFNAITVDGDTSTNDCVLALANGSGGGEIGGRDNQEFYSALRQVCQDLAYQIVQDAEGGTKVVHVNVFGGRDAREAQLAARAVGNSPLVKTALYGNDPNWGRIVAALGRSGADFDTEEVRVSIGSLCVFERGRPAEMDIDAVFSRFLRASDVHIDVQLGSGPGEYSLKTSDLSHEYVSINAEYRT